MPGPTGEANTLTITPRAPILCLGPGAAAAEAQADAVEALGGAALVVSGAISTEELATLRGYSGVMCWGPEARDVAEALAQQDGPILRVITGQPQLADVVQETHLCVDTTASGGNAALLAG